jgi:hypothetical protein
VPGSAGCVGLRRRLPWRLYFAAMLYLAVSALDRWYVLLASVFSLGVAVIAAWYILSRRGVARAVASGVATLALLMFVVV